MTISTLPPQNGDFSMSDYLTKQDISDITGLGTTMITTKIINGAVEHEHYIIGDNQTKLFKRSYIKQRVKEYKPTFPVELIDTYTPEPEQPQAKEQPTASTDNPELVQSLRDHVQSLTKQIDNLLTTNIQKDVQIAKTQELLEKTLVININYQKQFNVSLMKENTPLLTPKSDVLKEDEVSSQPNQKKGWFPWW